VGTNAFFIIRRGRAYVFPCACRVIGIRATAIYNFKQQPHRNFIQQELQDLAAPAETKMLVAVTTQQQAAAAAKQRHNDFSCTSFYNKNRIEKFSYLHVFDCVRQSSCHTNYILIRVSKNGIVVTLMASSVR
jgi:hypothetical protein